MGIEIVDTTAEMVKWYIADQWIDVSTGDSGTIETFFIEFKDGSVLEITDFDVTAHKSNRGEE